MKKMKSHRKKWNHTKKMKSDQLVDIIMLVTQWLYHGSAYPSLTRTAAVAASPAKPPDRDWPQPGQ